MNTHHWLRGLVVGLLVGIIGGGAVQAQPPIGDVKPVTKGVLTIGENPGGFDEGGANVWKYEGKAGEVLTLMAVAENPANNSDQETRDKDRLLDTVLVVYDPTNQVIAYNDDIVDAVLTNSFLRYVALKTDGTYTVKVTNWYTKSGDETGGHFTLMVYSNKPAPTGKMVIPKVLGTVTTSTDVLDRLNTIIKNYDTHTVMLINPTYCTITDLTFGDLRVDLKPYSGAVVQMPNGTYRLHGTTEDSTCVLNADEIPVPETATVMVVPIDPNRTRPSDAVPFPTNKDALANS